MAEGHPKCGGVRQLTTGQHLPIPPSPKPPLIWGLLTIILILGAGLGASLYFNIRASGELAHPTLSIWTLSQPISSGGLVHGVPDTFDYYIRYSSDVPVSVAILSSTQFVQMGNCPGSDIQSKLQCVTGSITFYSPATTQNAVFTLAEGCGGYIAVYYSSTSGTFHPNISIRYNPSSGLTGACVSAS